MINDEFFGVDLKAGAKIEFGVFQKRLSVTRNQSRSIHHSSFIIHH
jgi:hypothetical protein